MAINNYFLIDVIRGLILCSLGDSERQNLPIISTFELFFSSKYL